MATVINRADGQVLGQLNNEELKDLQNALVKEFEGDCDYNLQEATLELFPAPDWLKALVTEQKSLEIGIESEPFENSVTGYVKDQEGHPIAGLRVDFSTSENLPRTVFTRPDGSFSIESSDTEVHLLVIARGTLVLHELAAIFEENLEITIPVLKGRVFSTQGEVKRATVNLFEWSYTESEERSIPGCSSWASTDDSGFFRLPVTFSEGEEINCHLEVFSALGESLSDSVVKVLDLRNNNWELEAIGVTCPSGSWPPEEEEQNAEV